MRLELIFCFIPRLLKTGKMLNMIVIDNNENLNTTLKHTRRPFSFKKDLNENNVSFNPDGTHIHSETEEEKEEIRSRMNKIYMYSALLEKLNSQHISQQEKLTIINNHDIMPTKLYNLNTSGLYKDWDFVF